MTAAAEAAARAAGRTPHPDDWAPSPPQAAFLSLTCFEALYGGAAGGGKSDALLVDAIRYVGRGYGPHYNAILFRRTFPDLERSLIRRSYDLYPRLGGVFNASKFVWRFPGGETVAFGHLAHELDVLAHKSAQYQFVGFDELTSFTEFQYLYLISRLRSAHGVPVRLRAASNPGDIGHKWVRKRFAPWVSRKALRPALAGTIRYFVRRGDDDVEVPRGTRSALGRTFIPAKLEDNPTLDANDPEYRARLEALPPLERQRLLGGDWDAEPAAKAYYDRARIRILRVRPALSDIVAHARAWDFGSTSKGDPSAGVLGSWTEQGLFVVEHVAHGQWTPDRLHAEFSRIAHADLEVDESMVQWIPEDPGAAGKLTVADFQRRYPGLTIRARRPSGDKVTRFGPVSSRALAGNMAVVDDGSWDVEAYHAELEAFPLGANDDRVDATSDDYFAVASPDDASAGVSRGGRRR